ncbi:hypothetical protein Fmac_025387 [Flemingia macrophylla]|uniref:Uncharacterized protein n=1 Tax=Flemingia macrophylla TaxID=520843 RepID=A0ABD1LS51_9FABA
MALKHRLKQGFNRFMPSIHVCIVPMHLAYAYARRASYRYAKFHLMSNVPTRGAVKMHNGTCFQLKKTANSKTFVERDYIYLFESPHLENPSFFSSSAPSSSRRLMNPFGFIPAPSASPSMPSSIVSTSTTSSPPPPQPEQDDNEANR